MWLSFRKKKKKRFFFFFYLSRFVSEKDIQHICEQRKFGRTCASTQSGNIINYYRMRTKRWVRNILSFGSETSQARVRIVLGPKNTKGPKDLWSESSGYRTSSSSSILFKHLLLRNHSTSNFIWNFYGIGERKFDQIVLVT